MQESSVGFVTEGAQKVKQLSEPAFRFPVLLVKENHEKELEEMARKEVERLSLSGCHF